MAVSESRRSPGEPPQDTAPYWRRFRRDVFTLLKMGYDRLGSNQYKNSDEPDITGELIKAIKEVFDDSSTPTWAVRYSVHDDPPVSAPDRLGKSRRRVDIEFESSKRKPRTRFSFEAKRLSKGKSDASDYFGKGGMGMFLRGEYARNSFEAGMLGYVQSDTLDEWAEKLEKYFDDNDQSLMVCNDGQWEEAHDLNGFENCYRSKHNRSGALAEIVIYHTLLKFC